jgi:hypothetical protein
MTENLITLIEDIRSRSLQIAAELKTERAQHEEFQDERAVSKRFIKLNKPK